MPAVSVIIPAYLHGHYIREAVDSVFRQTYRDFEVIVINDGSPDDTEERLAELIRSGAIRYRQQANQGQAVARNAGVALASGQYIAFLDDDDTWPEDKLAWQVEEAERHPEAVVIGGSCLIQRPDGESAANAEAGVFDFDRLFDGCPFISPGQTLVRVDHFRAVGGLRADVPGADDFDLWFRLAQRGAIRRVARCALHYRIHETNASRRLERMLTNIDRVLQTHLATVPAEQRKACAARSYRWLYEYVGEPLLWQTKGRFLGGDLAGAWRGWRALWPLFRRAVQHPPLRGRIVREILPARFNRPTGK